MTAPDAAAPPSIVMGLREPATCTVVDASLEHLSPRMAVLLGLHPSARPALRVKDCLSIDPTLLSAGDISTTTVRPVSGPEFTATVSSTSDGRLALHYVTPPETALRLAREQRAILEQIAAGRPTLELLRAIAELAEREAPGNVRVSVLGIERETGVLRTLAQPSLPEDFVQAIDRLEPAPERASCGAAAATGLQVMTPRIAGDPWWTDFADFMEAYGIRASWSSPILGPQGEILGTFGMYYPDERVPTAAELDLIDTFTHLASLALQREASDNVRRESERLRERARDRESFFAAVTHDLRAPLQAIRLGIEELSESDRPDAERQLIHSLSDSCEYMLSIAQDATQLSKPFDAQELALEEIDPKQLLEQTARRLTPQANACQVGLFLAPVPDGLRVRADRSRISRVLVNLVSNAIGHSPEAGTVTLGITPDPDSEGMSTIWVADEGPGIPAERQALVFEPFVRLEGVEQQREGFGLGLAIVRRFVEAHGGRVGVESSPGSGSRFWITLPSCSPAPTSTATSEETASRPLAGVTVLIADDVPMVQAAMRRVLERAGAEVLLASDGQEAVAKFDQHRPRVVLLDARMPKMHGRDAARHIRQIASGDSPLIIGLSGLDGAPDEGLDLQLVKPVGGRKLIEALVSALADRRP